MSSQTDHESPRLDDDQPATPPPSEPRKSRRSRNAFIVLMLVLLSLAIWWMVQEFRTSTLQSRYFSGVVKQLTYKVEPGPSKSIRFPKESPYDERLGYANIPDYLARLKQRDYEITAQARFSPKMVQLADMGVFTTFREKTRTGLTIYDCRAQPLFTASYPERIYPGFEQAPLALIHSLLFIENRELLDTKYPTRNPAVEWDRLSKAILEKSASAVGLAGSRAAGGSTLATQIEKYRHSPEGRTGSMKDKLQQMVSATLRAYQQGEDTTAVRRQIVVDYLNTVPLSAKPGYGEVNGIGDGMWVWYGRDFNEVNELLSGSMDKPGSALAFKEALSLLIAQRRPSYYLGAGDEDLETLANSHLRLLAGRMDQPGSALVFKEALSLLIAQRRPTYYLGDGDQDLEELANSHLRLLAQAGVITPALRDAALQVKLRPAQGNGLQSAPPMSYVTKKASNAVRVHLANLLGDNRMYNLDRLDLSVVSTLDATAQKAVTSMLRDLREAEVAEKAGLTGKGMLGNGDPANVVYSFTLLEKGDKVNYLRVQTDNYDQPLDINEGAKLDLGSTAKLRTLVTYMDIVDQLHKKYGRMSVAELQKVVVDPKDRLTTWGIEYLAMTPMDKRDLTGMLNAAMERKYSGNPGEGFFTGGGLHYFGNFSKLDDSKILTVREGLRHSTNLLFVRLMRDVVRYYSFQTPGSSASLLADADDPRRAQYLARFADKEGKEFLYRFYAKYKGKPKSQLDKILVDSIRPTPVRLANIHRTLFPTASLGEFAMFVNGNLTTQNEVPQERLEKMYDQYAMDKWNLADRGYLANVHPLELWLVAYLRQHEGATLTQVVGASEKERQEVYQWLFKTHRKHAQDRRIAGLLEMEAFMEIHRQWKKMGYPFDSLVPSYATTLGASADRPASLAEMMGIIVNGGVRKPTQRIDALHFAAGTPYDTKVARAKQVAAEQVLSPEVARVVADEIRGVVSDGTAKRAKEAFIAADGTNIAVGGKTGTGDQRFDVYGGGGRLIESRYVNRSATFVFNIGERFFGSMTAYVHGPDSKNYDFTSALPVQLLTVLAPSLMPLIEPNQKVALPTDSSVAAAAAALGAPVKACGG